MSSNSKDSLYKEYISTCAICLKPIPDEVQSLKRKYCSRPCERKLKSTQQRNYKKAQKRTSLLGEKTRDKMRKEINELCKERN